MSAHILGLTFSLADGPIRTRFGRSEFDGKPTAHLLLGQGRDEIAIVASGSPVETLIELEAAVAELRAEAERQERLANLPEVA